MPIAPSRTSTVTRALLLLLAAGLILALCGARTACAQETLRAAQERSRMLIESLMIERQLPGVSVAVLADDEIVWIEGIGFADVENTVPMWPHTKMRVGSVSKAMTAVAVGQLVEAGRLDLDAPVQRYVPSFPEKRWPVTTRQVAGHLAGIRHYRGDEFYSARHYETVRDGLEVFADDSLLYEPGSAYTYSSYGWNLVSAVVEGASGVEFLAYMRRHVFEPLGMVHTVADHTDSLLTNRSRYYAVDEHGTLVNAPYVDNSLKWAGGGFLSSAEDLVRFGHGLLRTDLLRPETKALLFTSQRTLDGEETGYGIGFETRTDAAGRRVVGHGGGSVGGTTSFAMYPAQGLVVAIVTNLSEARFGDVPAHVAEAFLRGLGRAEASE